MKNTKNKKDLLFLKQIKPEMSVDDIFNSLIKILKNKGINIYPDNNHDKGAE